jgi:hypothetical protein
MKTNFIKAKVMEGEYKGKNIEVIIGKDGNHSKVLINGKNFSHSVSGIQLNIKPMEQTTLILTTTKIDDEEKK